MGERKQPTPPPTDQVKPPPPPAPPPPINVTHLHAAPPIPHVPCPKCGHADGWHGPTYDETASYSFYEPNGLVRIQHDDWLLFTCNTCGYRQRVRPLDYVPSSPPPPDPSSNPNTPVPDGPRWRWLTRLLRLRPLGSGDGNHIGTSE